MSKLTEKYEKEVEEILERERWQGYVSGKVEGALNVLYALDLDKEQRIELLMEAVGLCNATAVEYIEPREIQYRIYKNENLTNKEKESLDTLMSLDVSFSERVLDHPVETLGLISSMSGEVIIDKCMPQVEIWVENGEEVSMKRVRDWLIEQYQLL